MRFSSESKDFLYYQTPTIGAIQPTCGPFSGYTQISVTGKDFNDMGFGKVKCIFNSTMIMNATIVNETLIMCDSPRLSEYD